MEPVIKTETSYFLTKEEIIEKFDIEIPEGMDTWSYYRDNVLEIKIVPKPEKPPVDPVEEETPPEG